MKELAITEKVFTAQVTQLAQICGWEVYHPWLARHSRAGFPDLTLWHPKYQQHFYAELKTNTGKLTVAQDSTIQSLRAAAVEVRVWRPCDWAEIEARLLNRELVRESQI